MEKINHAHGLRRLNIFQDTHLFKLFYRYYTILQTFHFKLTLLRENKYTIWCLHFEHRFQQFWKQHIPMYSPVQSRYRIFPSFQKSSSGLFIISCHLLPLIPRNHWSALCLVFLRHLFIESIVILFCVLLFPPQNVFEMFHIVASFR